MTPLAADAPPAPETLPLPPGSPGLPWMGETLEFLRSSRHFIERRQACHGDVFRSHILGSPAAFLVGPEALQWIFAGEGKYLQNRWSPAVRRLLGANSLALLEGDAHLERRRLLAPHFSYAAMRGFVPVIESLAARHLTRWAERPGDFTLWPAMRELAFEIALTLLFGERAVDVPYFMRHFQRWTAGLFVPVPIDLPWTKFGRALASKRAMLDALHRLVSERQALAEQPPDLLGSLLSPREGEAPLSREAIIDELQLLLFAGHDTTVTALSNLMLLLARHPEALEKGRAAVAGLSGPLTLDALRATPYLMQLLHEGMRAIPPIGGAFRVTTRDVAFKGYRIPKGWTVPVSIRSAHLTGAAWPEPDRFDPERFGAERTEPRRPGTFVPFGGGPRICLGQHFAMVEMSVVLALLLQHYTWELVPGQDLEYVQIPFPQPRSGIQLRMRRLGAPGTAR
ncbi:cytochrome P450 [Melittangium boletus]|uniref:cytochrome P450 n=1 Tax=Melittangium boletus TaxID=83453 RepID=UPI003DA57B5E